MYWHPRTLRNFDWWLSLFVLVLTGVGLIMVFSAVTAFADSDEVRSHLVKQGAAIAMGVVAWVVLVLFDYTELRLMYRVLYAVNIGMLVLVLLIGVEINGSKSWIDLGPILVQPAEFSKILLILTLSHLLDRMERLTSWWDLALPALHALPVLGLVLVQGDLGTALVLAAICVVLVYAAGFPGTKLAAAGLAAFLVVGGIIFSHYQFGTQFPFKEHQWERIHIFLYPESDPLGAGWQVMQSKAAIGSGSMWGSGLGQGIITHSRWLPFQHTDFIFAVLAEEFGFVGGIVVLVLYALVFFRLGSIAQQARDRYGSLLCIGVAGLLGAHVIENIGMTLGLTPVTGIPLPFISYGPTALVSYLTAVGLAQSVAVHRDTITF